MRIGWRSRRALASRRQGAGARGPLGAPAQGRLEVGRAPVFLQKIPERLGGELLKIHLAVARQEIESAPGLFVERHALAGHLRRSVISPAPE